MIESIARYWDKQSAIWRGEKDEAWNQPETGRWGTYFRGIHAQLPGADALEVGTASGYFANIMSAAGFAVTAVDLSPGMVHEAQQVSERLGIPVVYHVMDAQQLAFEDNRFDLVFTRLMTWTVPDVRRFYAEALRVLKPGGRFINFDGDFGACRFSQEGHERYPAEIMEEANTIKAQLEVSGHKRPAWDAELLADAGFEEVVVTPDAQYSILGGERQASGLFRVEATKPLAKGTEK